MILDWRARWLWSRDLVALHEYCLLSVLDVVLGERRRASYGSWWRSHGLYVCYLMAMVSELLGEQLFRSGTGYSSRRHVEDH